MSVPLVILGLLSERPRHGYELRQEVERRAYATYINLSGGSLYYNLSQLERVGYIEKVRTEQKGRYPTRQIFQITPAGKEFLRTEVRRLLFDIDSREKLFDPLNAALAFGHLVSPADLREALTAHLERMRQRLRWVEEQRAYWLEKNIPFVQLKIIEHGHVHLRAELAWLEEFLTQLSEALVSEAKPSGSGRRPQLSEALESEVSERSERSVQSHQPDGHHKVSAEEKTSLLTAYKRV